MPSKPSDPMSSLSSVSLYDARPFFEKALQYGVQTGIIDRQKLDVICTDAPKGMVQIARYFGTEFLRPELEKARDRIVNLVSLYLESTTGGDLRQAAESLRDHSFLSRSKGGSDMLKALIAMPQNSHFGMSERGGFTDEHIPVLAKWSLRSLPDYQAELARRQQVGQVMDAAIWLADTLGMDAAELEEVGVYAETVIRTVLLVRACGRSEMPDRVDFEKMVDELRTKYRDALARSEAKTRRAASARAQTLSITIPKNLPDEFRDLVQDVRQSVLAHLPKILDDSLSAQALFSNVSDKHTAPLLGSYFWVEDKASEIYHYEQSVSSAWDKVTGGNRDEGSLLTLLVCVAAGTAPKTLLSEKAARTLVRKIQKSGLKPEVANQYILAYAPAEYQEGYLKLWADFVDEAQHTLQSDAMYASSEALALLRRECHVK